MTVLERQRSIVPSGFGNSSIREHCAGSNPQEVLNGGGWNIHPLEVGTPSPRSGWDGEVEAPYTTFLFGVSRQLMETEETFLLDSTCEGFCPWEAGPRGRYLPMWLCIVNAEAARTPLPRGCLWEVYFAPGTELNPLHTISFDFSNNSMRGILLLVPF